MNVEGQNINLKIDEGVLAFRPIQRLTKACT